MTANQLRYWELQETKRKNRAGERIETDKLSESIRHNKIDEGIKIAKVVTDTISSGTKNLSALIDK